MTLAVVCGAPVLASRLAGFGCRPACLGSGRPRASGEQAYFRSLSRVGDHLVSGIKVTDEPVKDESFWQSRADEARRIAESLTHPAAKRELLLVAEQFEILARQARKQKRHNGLR